MRRIMLMGERGVGRRTVARLLGCTVPDLRRTMAVEYAGEFVFPPPEFLENRRFLLRPDYPGHGMRGHSFCAGRHPPNLRLPAGFCPHIQPHRRWHHQQDRHGDSQHGTRTALSAQRRDNANRCAELRNPRWRGRTTRRPAPQSLIPFRHRPSQQMRSGHPPINHSPESASIQSISMRRFISPA